VIGVLYDNLPHGNVMHGNVQPVRSLGLAEVLEQCHAFGDPIDVDA
jgi:hypothetical protein